MGECARHLRLALQRVPLEAAESVALAPHGGPDTSRAPGTEALLDILGAHQSQLRCYGTVDAGYVMRRTAAPTPPVPQAPRPCWTG